MLVSLADGRLVSLDESSGELLWTFDTGAPLMTSANPATAPTDDAPDLRDNDTESSALPLPKEGIFPGTDGSLYIYRSSAMAAGYSPPQIEARWNAIFNFF